MSDAAIFLGSLLALSLSHAPGRRQHSGDKNIDDDNEPFELEYAKIYISEIRRPALEIDSTGPDNALI